MIGWKHCNINRGCQVFNPMLWQGHGDSWLICLIQIFAPQCKQGMFLANNFNERRLRFSFFPLLLQTYTRSNRRHLEHSDKWCFCCIFNRAAQFNPTLTLKAQGLIPSPVKAFVWGSTSPPALATPSLQCPSKAYTGRSSLRIPLKKRRRKEKKTPSLPSLHHPSPQLLICFSGTLGVWFYFVDSLQVVSHQTPC